MNKKVKKEWVKALRSGEYKQGQGYLCDHHDQFCCLGVLIDTQAEGHWQRNEYSGYGVWNYRGDCLTIPKDLQIRWGLENDDLRTLVNKNDIRNQSFKEIADYIEEEL